MKESKQKYIGRSKPPRVQITYDLETEGAIIQRELPFVIGVIADFVGYREGLKVIPYTERKFIYLTPGNFLEVMQSLSPQLNVAFNVGDERQSSILRFSSIDDFAPDKIICQIPALDNKFRTRVLLSDLKTRLMNNSKLYQIAVNFMNQIPVSSNENPKAQDTPNPKNGKSQATQTSETKSEAKLPDLEVIFKDFQFINDEQKQYVFKLFQQLAKIEYSKDQEIITCIQKQILSCDGIIQKALNQILHTPEFQRLEGTWRGLFYLLKNLPISVALRIRILNATFDEVKDDLDKALEFDQSILFKKLYEEEYGTYGGNPYGLLLFDHYIRRNQQDFMFLNRISEVVACAHIPTAVGVHPSLFDINGFDSLHIPRDIAAIFESPELAAFNGFRESDDSRYVSLLLPRVMSRIPYGINNPIKDLNFEETITSHEDFAWSNAIYTYGRRIGEAFEKFGWFSSIIGAENGGMVDELPVYTYKTHDGELVIKCPTETAITDRREKELSNQGFISLCYCKDTNYSVFFSGQSSNKPQLFDKPEANRNAQISARFQYILNTSRFAHYIKCIMRDKIGSFHTKETIELLLQKWIEQYVLILDNAPQDIKARYPLREAKIEVKDNLKAGCYDAIIWLRPHMQMEELTVSLRLVARLPKVGE